MVEPLFCVYIDSGVRISTTREYLIGQRLGFKGMDLAEIKDRLDRFNGRLTNGQKGYNGRSKGQLCLG